MANREINLTSDGLQVETQCHLLPCKVGNNFNQSAKVREYFLPTIRPLMSGGDDDEDIKELKRLQNNSNDSKVQILLASFRGRPLQGRHVVIPDGFVGHYIRKEDGIKSEATSATKFDKFAYWNWDELPSENDSAVKAIGWIRVSKSIHDPIQD